MHRLEPVVWARGTLLNPQHLQHQDRFLESSLQFRTQALQFRPWGFRTLGIDQEALAAGTLALTEASGILPDGLLFDLPRADSAPPARAFSEHLTASHDTVDVYLAIPEYRDGGMNIATPGREARTRYRAETEYLQDEYSDSAEKPVLVARKNFRLVIGDESRQGLSALCVARVQRSPAGLFQLHPSFIPPVLDLRASDLLVSIERRLLEVLSGKSSTLSGLRRQKNQTLADFTAADVPRFWLLYTVNTFLPLFRHIYESKGGHPESLFSAMTELAGALTTFSTRIQPKDLPRYDHEELGACFRDLDEKVRMLLETVLPTNFVSLALRLVQPSIYSAAVEQDSYFSETRMYLAIRSDVARAELIDRTPHLVKASSLDSVEHLVQQALPGIALTHVATPPAALPVKLDYEYFGLSQHGTAWESVKKARNFTVYVPSELHNPDLELIILLSKSS
ncbi:MAG: type VI secretion system baseplate subunit TssK [Bryobacteraceae bacterium]|nr:type VI secretion system baseplate subunit TssK [Bryobacteraceae bacterium]